MIHENQIEDNDYNIEEFNTFDEDKEQDVHLVEEAMAEEHACLSP